MFDGIIYKYTCIPTGLSYVGQAIGDGSIRHSQFMSLGTVYRVFYLIITFYRSRVLFTI